MNIQINEVSIIKEYMPLAQKIALIERAYHESSKFGAPNALYFEAVVVVDSMNYYTDLFLINKELQEMTIDEAFDVISSDAKLKGLVGGNKDWGALLKEASSSFEFKTLQSQNLNGLFLQIKPILDNIIESLKIREGELGEMLMNYLINTEDDDSTEEE